MRKINQQIYIPSIKYVEKHFYSPHNDRHNNNISMINIQNELFLLPAAIFLQLFPLSPICRYATEADDQAACRELGFAMEIWDAFDFHVHGRLLLMHAPP